MQVIRRSLQESAISSDIVDIIMHSWRDSTQKQYKVYINKWLQFCNERKIDPLHPTVTAVLSFLHSLFKSGLSYSALNTARSAVSNIDYYLQATEKLRNSSKLLVSYIKPYKAVTSSTIGRWIKTLLGQAGVDTEIFSGHSTRCASTSKALMSVSTDVILATAGWTEESTFRKFYHKPVAVTNQMSLAVLT
ncbi:unnamed protein product [Porites evermanni]|uniref:Core-binding (CB) domain-containing protein n=1 Tax=Porites evermanni TaxID=104178 RepID=A0ABN8PZI4_9CNID|nr:unnamed protein product [Porites evermanni]